MHSSSGLVHGAANGQRMMDDVVVSVLRLKDRL